MKLHRIPGKSGWSAREFYEAAEVNAEIAALKQELNAYKRILENVRAGNYDNAHDIAAALKYIHAEIEALKASNDV